MNPPDRSEVQGNILRGYRHGHAAYLFVGVDDAAAGRRWLRELIDEVELEVGPLGSCTLNLALTFEGLVALGLDPEALAGFPLSFREGMAARAARIGDIGPNAPETWEAGLGTGAAHVLVTIYAGEAAQRDARLAACAQRVTEEAGLQVAFRQCADAWPDAREHFGFADGFSQPALPGGTRPARGEGVRRRFGRWRPLRLGEFVGGHEDEDGVIAGGAAPLLRDGTFMVWRKLAQDVPRFRSWLRELAGDDPEQQERVAAKIVGRWREGESLVRAPDSSAPPMRDNGFTYAGDRAGIRCPAGSHVRRANPRDALGWGTERTRRHRILRRGMPYGPRLPETATEDDGHERGLIFVCLNASISRQFELIQGHWLLGGDASGIGPDRDLLLAPEDPLGKMTVPGRPPRFLAPQAQLVTMRGGEYLFVPGMTALRTIATG